MSESQTQVIDLSHLDDMYNEAEVQENAFEPIPDGTYQVIIDRIFLATSKKGKPMLKWQLNIVSGPYEGKKLFRQNMLETAQNITWLKTDFSRCDMAHVLPSQLSDEAILAQFLDIYLEVTAKSKGTDDQGRPNQNVYIQKRLYPSGEGTPGSQARPPASGNVGTPEDEIPF